MYGVCCDGVGVGVCVIDDVIVSDAGGVVGSCCVGVITAVVVVVVGVDLGYGGIGVDGGGCDVGDECVDGCVVGGVGVDDICCVVVWLIWYRWCWW